MSDSKLKILIKRKEDNKYKVLLAKHYDQMAVAILDLLKEKNELTLKELIELINQQLAETFKSEINWYLLTVKADLEAQGIIRTTFKKRLSPSLKISIRTYKKSKFYKDRKFQYGKVEAGI